MLRYPGTWVYWSALILTNPVWWFYNNWVPSFLFSKFNVNLMASGLPLVVIYLMTDVGLDRRRMAIGRFAFESWAWGLHRPETGAIDLCRLHDPGVHGPQINSIWPAVLLIGLAMAAHQGFSANLFTLVSDTMPKGRSPER